MQFWDNLDVIGWKYVTPIKQRSFLDRYLTLDLPCDGSRYRDRIVLARCTGADHRPIGRDNLDPDRFRAHPDDIPPARKVKYEEVRAGFRRVRDEIIRGLTGGSKPGLFVIPHETIVHRLPLNSGTSGTCGHLYYHDPVR